VWPLSNKHFKFKFYFKTFVWRSRDNCHISPSIIYTTKRSDVSIAQVKIRLAFPDILSFSSATNINHLLWLTRSFSIFTEAGQKVATGYWITVFVGLPTPRDGRTLPKSTPTARSASGKAVSVLSWRHEGFKTYGGKAPCCEPDRSVSIVSGYGLDDRAIEVLSPAEAKEFFL
jgi:hypothetical protein